MENEEGGGFFVVLAFGFVGACLAVCEGGLVATEGGVGVAVGGATVG